MRVARVAATLASGALIGAVGVVAFGTSATNPDPTPATTPLVETNEYGLQIGDLMAGGVQPDLVPTRTEDGRDAFMRPSDIITDRSATPGNVNIPTDGRQIDKRGKIYTTAYGPDGKRVVGRVLLGSYHEASAEELNERDD